MKRAFHNLLKLLLVIAAGILVYFAGILIIATINDYKPEGGKLNTDACSDMAKIPEGGLFSILTWNIGYAGLGENSDFFYDGGQMSRPTQHDYNNYLQGIVDRMKQFNSLDFILLQEVDTEARRSFGVNQYQMISESLGSHCGIFVKNYDVFYVPVPIFKPMAWVTSGLAVYSRYLLTGSEHTVFPENYSWPTGLFMPDRCFVSAIFTSHSGKKLHIINTHNSAFDDGELRNSQMALLTEYMMAAYQNGDYVIAGGDWNINPKGYVDASFLSGDPPFYLPGIENVSGPDPSWNVSFDPEYPTNRDVSSPYTPGLTPTTILDFYVCSPNVSLHEIQTLYDGFKNTDHQPVLLRFELK